MDSIEPKEQKRKDCEQKVKEILKTKYGLGDGGDTSKPPEKPLNPKSVKLVKYGFMAASVAFATIAILVYKSGNQRWFRKLRQALKWKFCSNDDAHYAQREQRNETHQKESHGSIQSEGRVGGDQGREDIVRVEHAI